MRLWIECSRDPIRKESGYRYSALQDGSSGLFSHTALEEAKKGSYRFDRVSK